MGLKTCLKISRSDAAVLLEDDELFDEEDFDDDDFEDELETTPGPSGFSNAKIIS